MGLATVVAIAMMAAPSSAHPHRDAPNGTFSEVQSVTAPAEPDSTTTTAVLCKFLQHGDNPHLSSTAPRTASVHGWWENIDCKASKAVVTIQLQRKNSLGFWFDVGTEGRKTVCSGGGSANRANSRYLCNGSARVQFRVWVDVDVVGVADASNRTYSSAFTLACG